MRCAAVERLLSDYLDGTCASSRRDAIADHLKHCPSCATSFARLERTRALVAGARAPEPGDGYWADFWPRMEERLAGVGEPRPSLAERLSILFFPRRLAGLLSPAPALVILALVCFNVFLLAQVRRGAPDAGLRREAPLIRDEAERRLPALAARGGRLEVGRGRAPGDGVDAVLCDSGGRAGVDEYVLQPAAFHRSARGARTTDYILARTVEPPSRDKPRWSY